MKVLKSLVVFLMATTIVCPATAQGPSGPGDDNPIAAAVACSKLKDVPCRELQLAFPLLFSDMSCQNISCKFDTRPLPGSNEPANEWMCGNPVENPQTLDEQKTYEFRIKPNASFPEIVPVADGQPGHHEFEFIAETNLCMQERPCSLCDNGFIQVPQNSANTPKCMPNDGPLAPQWGDCDWFNMGSYTPVGEGCTGCGVGDIILLP